jgi:hypothetical protein
VVVLSAAVAVLAWFIGRAWRRAGNRLRFSLRSVFILTTMVAISIAWWIYQRDRATKIARINSTLSDRFGSSTTNTSMLAWQMEPTISFSNWEYAGPQWLQRIVPAKWLKNFQRPTALKVLPWRDDEAGAKAVAEILREIPEIRQLRMTSPAVATQIDSKLLQSFSRPGVLDGVEELSIRSPSIESDLQWISRLPQLRRLEIRQDTFDRSLGVSGFDRLANCQQLVGLRLENVNMRAEWLARLVGLSRLRDLSVTSAMPRSAVEVLLKFPSLESLTVNCRELTDEGLIQLLAMPRLQAIEATNTGHLKAETRTAISQRPIDANFMIGRIKVLPIGQN